MALKGSKNTPLVLVALAAHTGSTASGTDTSYGTGNNIIDLTGAGPINAVAFELNCTVQAADVGDKLDVYVQTSLDGGSTWVDIVHFTQILGNVGAAKVYYAKVENAAALTEFETGTALGAAAHRDFLGTHLRAKIAITNDADATVDSSFTFSLIGVAS